MKNIIFVGSHLGYPMEKTPLGGGAMVGLNLAREWAREEKIRLTILGSGPHPPVAGAKYIQVAVGGRAANLTALSEFEYASFCRNFEREATTWLAWAARRINPRTACVVVNDISEGPDLEELARLGYFIVSLWHVDVVDYFNRIYLGSPVSTERLIRIYERVRRLSAGKILPDVLKLVFEKQRSTVLFSDSMIFPSRAMAEVVGRSYSVVSGVDRKPHNRVKIVPWGVWDKEKNARTPLEERSLKSHYQIRPDTLVLMTLSRISPEKGLDLLLEALRILERRGAFAGKDICVLVCGEPSFMRGRSYWKKVRAAAKRLRAARVFFPGYLGPEEKAAFFSLANLFISSSIHESYGLNIMEAMAAGLPVLALDHHGTKDWPNIGFGEKVRAAKPRFAPVALAEAIGGLLHDRERLNKMGRLAAAFACAQPFSKAAREVLETAVGLISSPAQEEAALVE